MCFDRQSRLLASTHNLTLIRAAFEIVELDVKLHDVHPQVKKPKLPTALLSMPMPPKRMSAFLNTLSRLASPGAKLSPAKPGYRSRLMSISTTTPTGAEGSSTASPSHELDDPFSQVTSDADSSTFVPPNNPITTSLAAYLTYIANDQIHRQTRVWKRFVRVRPEDFESARVERAIQRVRSDLAPHLKHPSIDIPGPGSISTSLSKDGGDTVIVSTGESSHLAPEPSPTGESAKKLVEEDVSPPSKATQGDPMEQTDPNKGGILESGGTPEEPKNRVSIPDSEGDTGRIPLSQSAEPPIKHSNFNLPPLNGRGGTLSQTSETVDDESSLVFESKECGGGSRARQKQVATKELSSSPQQDTAGHIELQTGETYLLEAIKRGVDEEREQEVIQGVNEPVSTLSKWKRMDAMRNADCYSRPLFSRDNTRTRGGDPLMVYPQVHLSLPTPANRPASV